MWSHAFITVLLCSMGIGNCSDNPVEQSVSIQVDQEGEAVAGVELALFQGDACVGSAIHTGTTDAAGRMQFRRPAMRGRLVIRLEHLALCERKGDRWKRIWTEGYAPGSRLTLHCKTFVPLAVVCATVP